MAAKSKLLGHRFSSSTPMTSKYDGKCSGFGDLKMPRFSLGNGSPLASLL